jgi:hypothetical protein
MARKIEFIEICGVEVEYLRRGDSEFITIDLHDLYNGYGKLNDLGTLSEILAMLHSWGYKSLGIYTTPGPYDAIDGIKLELVRVFIK